MNTHTQMAAEQMAQTIDRQHRKNLDLVHTLACMSQHFQKLQQDQNDTPRDLALQAAEGQGGQRAVA